MGHYLLNLTFVTVAPSGLNKLFGAQHLCLANIIFLVNIPSGTSWLLTIMMQPISKHSTHCTLLWELSPPAILRPQIDTPWMVGLWHLRYPLVCRWEEYKEALQLEEIWRGWSRGLLSDSCSGWNWAAVLWNCIQDVLKSSYYSVWDFLWFFSVPSGKFQMYYLD
jgi:hypothetical protein